MYIPEFYAGVFATLFAEVVILIAAVIYSYNKKNKR